MHRYSIPKMTCGRCAGTIQAAVKAVDPKALVIINLEAKEVAIRTMPAKGR